MAERRGGQVRRGGSAATDRTVRRWSVPPRRACVLGVMTLALWAALGGTAYAGAVTSGSVLTSTKAAIAQQTGVHVVFRANRASSATTEKIVADVGVTTGQETVSEGQSHVAIRVTPGYGYVSGDSSGLTTIFGLTADQAKKVGSDWVSWRAGHQPVCQSQGRRHLRRGHRPPAGSEGHEAVHRPHQRRQRVRLEVDGCSIELHAEAVEHADGLGQRAIVADRASLDRLGRDEGDHPVVGVGRACSGQRAARGLDHHFHQDHALKPCPLRQHRSRTAALTRWECRSSADSRCREPYEASVRRHRPASGAGGARRPGRSWTLPRSPAPRRP